MALWLYTFNNRFRLVNLIKYNRNADCSHRTTIDDAWGLDCAEVAVVSSLVQICEAREKRCTLLFAITDAENFR